MNQNNSCDPVLLHFNGPAALSALSLKIVELPVF